MPMLKEAASVGVRGTRIRVRVPTRSLTLALRLRLITIISIIFFFVGLFRVRHPPPPAVVSSSFLKPSYAALAHIYLFIYLFGC